MPQEFTLSRRKALAALGTVGAASAGAGLGTSAFFSDEESFQNNRLVAGELDMHAAYSAHYSDWSPEDGAGVPTDLCEYLYHDLSASYPVLASLADLGSRLERTRRRVERGLATTP